MRDLKTVATLVYFAVALVVWAVFTGDLYRGDLPLSLSAGLQLEAGKLGVGKGDLALTVVLYLIYYSFLFGLPYIVVRAVLSKLPKSLKREAIQVSAITAAWCALTFVLYHNALFSLIRIMNGSSASEWLSILWTGGLVVVIMVWFSLLRRASSGARRNPE